MSDDLIDLYMIRHAPVINKSGTIYGDDAQIDLQSVDARIHELAQTLPKPDQALWFHSGVERTKLTAQAVLDVQQNSHDELQRHMGFKEQDFGALIGQKHEDIEGHLRFVDGKVFAPNPPDGESIGALKIRVADALFDVFSLARQQDKNKIVIFTHGGTIRAARLVIEQRDLSEFIAHDTEPLCLYQP